MAEHQGPRRYAACEISVDGQNLTSKLFPFLISVQVIDSVEGGHSECHLELDDRDAMLQIPPDSASLKVALGWAGAGPRIPDLGRASGEITSSQRLIMDEFAFRSSAGEMPFGGPALRPVFSGTVSSVESGFGRRGGGRRMWIEATSGNVKGLSKEVQQGTWGMGQKTDGAAGGAGGAGGAAGGAGGADAGREGQRPGPGQGLEVPLKTVLTEIFGKTGIQVKMSPEMEKVARSFWRVNQSPADFLRSIAKEVGGVMKIENGIASLVGRFEGINADGDPMPNVDAVWGINLIGWRIKPYVGRPQYGKAASKVFDLFKGEWDTIEAAIGGDKTFFSGAKAIAHLIRPAADKATAEQGNTGTSTDSQSRRGTGWVLINGEPYAKAQGFVTISEARPGVDGKYLITEVEHNYTRGVGYTTRMNVQYPTPNYGPGMWGGDTGKYDPNAPKPAPPPPDISILPPGTKRNTKAEREAMRRHYTVRGMAIPPALAEALDPPAPTQEPI